MKHASIRELFDYWTKRRGVRRMPDRSEIEPGAIRRALADTFILAVDPRSGHPFRIAGTRVCAAFGRELKATVFTDLWAPDSRARIRDLVAIVTAESVGVVAGVCSRNEEGTALDLEMLILPLAHRGRADVRIIGALAPKEIPYWFGIQRLGPLELGTIRYLGPQTDRRLAPRLVPETPTAGRTRHGLVVYDGGG
jgi:hypothetical protein